MQGLPIPAQSPPPPAFAPREVLAISSSVQNDMASPVVDQVHTLLELPLNHLGVIVRRWHVDRGPPADVDPQRLRAVITWFDGDEPAVPWLMPWLERQRRRAPALRFVHIQDFGPMAADEIRLDAWLKPFGMRFDRGYVGDPLRVDVAFADESATCYEARPVYRQLHHGPCSEDPSHEVWVTTKDRDAANGDRRTPVVTGAFGGLALAPWTVRPGAHNDRRWHLDPFRFLRRALDLDCVVVADPMVRFGRRVLVFHVDGDGFESQSTVTPGRSCAEVFLDRIIDRFRMPMTVSVIVRGLSAELHPDRPTPAMELARDIFSRPWVEPASHGVLHPLHWRRPLTSKTAPRTVTWYAGLSGYRYDAVAEVRESIAFIDRWLAAPQRPCRVMLWTGLANPPVEALRECARLGCANMNGGVYRWDDNTDSVGYVSPWGCWLADPGVPGSYQVYAGAANENDFAGFFDTMPAAFRHIDSTIERTGRDRILRPANVYVHFYSAERPARLRSLEELLVRWSEREATIPVTVASYARAVASAQQPECRVQRTAAGFRVVGLGDCRCVRVDRPPGELDWQRCRGAVGARRLGGALYVETNTDEVELAFAVDAAPRPHLIESDHLLEEVELRPHGIAFRSRSRRSRTIRIGGLPPAGEVAVRWGDAEFRLPVDDSGECRLLFETAGDDRVEVRVR